jgi:sec-independent protein translocase protein TatA
MFAFIGTSHPVELLIVGTIALLLFGKKLPDVARSLGKSFSEFKKGVQGLQNEFTSASNEASRPLSSTPAPSPRPAVDDYRDVPSAPKFEPPKFEPPKFEPG